VRRGSSSAERSLLSFFSLGVKGMGPRVIEMSKKYMKVEIADKVLKLPRSAVIKCSNDKILFRNPLTRMICVAFFE
jgi:hypothetical protein